MKVFQIQKDVRAGRPTFGKVEEVIYVETNDNLEIIEAVTESLRAMEYKAKWFQAIGFRLEA